MGRVLPILFNTSMVMEIIDGQKTVTRRAIKKLPTDAEFKGWLLDSTCQNDSKYIGCAAFKTTIHPTLKEERVFVKTPFDNGDILYVRETFYKDENCVLYKADNPNMTGYRNMQGEDIEIKWTPSIHMPKGTARIFLKVTDVRVERLHDITTDQAIKEGFVGSPCSCGGHAYPCTDCYNTGWREPPEIGFIYTWDSTCKKSLQVNGWEANPWVWVIEFERCEKPDKQQKG